VGRREAAPSKAHRKATALAAKSRQPDRRPSAVVDKPRPARPSPTIANDIAKAGRVDRASGPSYDCRRDRGAITRAICGDPGLAALDRRMSARFAALDASRDAATVQRIHHGQTAFLNARQRCDGRACLVRAYTRRLHQLQGM